VLDLSRKPTAVVHAKESKEDGGCCITVPQFLCDESTDEVWKSLLQSAGDSGIDPAIIYTMNKTGGIVTEANLQFLTESELLEWNDAVTRTKGSLKRARLNDGLLNDWRARRTCWNANGCRSCTPLAH
jgi:hypothetical protein